MSCARTVASLASLTWRANRRITQAATSEPISSAIRRRVRPATGRSDRLPSEAAAAGVVGRLPGSGTLPPGVSNPGSAAGRLTGRGIDPRVAALDSAVNPIFARFLPARDGRCARAVTRNLSLAGRSVAYASPDIAHAF